MQVSDALTKEPTRRVVHFAGLDLVIEVVGGETLLQCARRTGMRMVGACGGEGACGSCAFRIISGKVEFLDGDVDDRLSFEQGNQWMRACRIRPVTDCVVEVAPRAFAQVVRTDAEADDDDAAFPFSPLVSSFDVEMAHPALAENGGDFERLLNTLGKERIRCCDLGALQQLPPMLRENDWRLRACERDGELLGVIPVGKRLLGLAVDLGTTNVAAYLIDLETGARLASLGLENPQVAYGADLISRMNHAIRLSGGQRELQRAAVEAITTLATDLCSAVSASPDEIADITLCGNTAMHHLLLGLPVSQLGRAPFVPAACTALDIKTRDLGISVLPGAYLHVLPNIGGFVGGDHVATLLATEKHWTEGTSLIVDVGTNTEISLIHHGTIVTASTPSGPALEGGNISSGMRAAHGAIERVRFSSGDLQLEVIGGGIPVGICGSGVVDALAALSRAQIIDRRGRICLGHPAVREAGDRRECLLAPQVAFTQEDVRAVQLAKAAIRAGIDLLIREYGLVESDIDRVVIAGAFGVYLDVRSCIRIGMFPDIPRERFTQVGNAAGAGVRMTLTSRDAREKAGELAVRCRHFDLSTQPDFQKVFMKRIGL
ncbi:ASKHA domain-containing protein [Desulfuromonas sp. TF]|uniref:ASKHA domain-containing protein n=1 Tax=Desulfuromonas sp. TF TaxID=1232410 RepID=UPI0004185081|nr:ASKHA domain-containing protein [Desulfuromonas sp. TF]